MGYFFVNFKEKVASLKNSTYLKVESGVNHMFLEILQEIALPLVVIVIVLILNKFGTPEKDTKF